jgi:large subunit ribosomal protein L32
MAAAVGSTLLPRLSSPTILASSRWATFYTRHATAQLFPTLSIALPGLSLNIPALLDDIWDSVLRAVPKKKTSHSKKRSRQMAGKALKDVNSLCKCPACGQLKRTHRICAHCLAEMKNIWRQDDPNDPIEKIL